ncbi:hypothetical protein H9L39_06062 [Fusarium oxysporum f. sp. albedinis]|nr:hypothetical protein FOMA001_g5804 [Fusarium oxysporum f. sp. matthiolae]KAK2484270.1 hypothetical protein H9L39_06062 [Fusarium oxysporum f. sp. albedinis]
MADCCVQGFRWDATPKGRNDKVAGIDCYVTGSNEGVTIMMIHDLFGWTFSNTRILADYYAEEVGATVLVPDFFGGEILPANTILDDSRWAELDLPAFLARNSKSVRGPEIIKTAEALRASYRRFGVMGFCFGGWGAFHIGAKDKQLADCISVAHPTMVEKTEIDALAVPVQIMAPGPDVHGGAERVQQPGHSKARNCV